MVDPKQAQTNLHMDEKGFVDDGFRDQWPHGHTGWNAERVGQLFVVTLRVEVRKALVEVEKQLHEMHSWGTEWLQQQPLEPIFQQARALVDKKLRTAKTVAKAAAEEVAKAVAKRTARGSA